MSVISKEFKSWHRDLDHIFSKNPQWKEVKTSCQLIREQGGVVFIVGGAVRDALMEKVPHDFDLVTDLKQEKIEKLFPQALVVGRSFGITIVPLSHGCVEIAVFRKDGEYYNGRHPVRVDPGSPLDDVYRRDFTVNGLFYDPKKRMVFDAVGAVDDLNSGVIRTIGIPEKRFQEDRLRMLRAIRFACQLGMKIEKQTWRALWIGANHLKSVSRERVREEFGKILSFSQRRQALLAVTRLKFWNALFPEVRNPSNLWWSLIDEFHNSPLKARNSWFLFLLAFKKGQHNLPFSKNFLREIECDRRALIGLLNAKKIREGELRLKLKDASGEFLWRVALKIQSSLKTEETRILDIIEDVKKNGLPQPVISGKDLLKLNIQPGKEFGKILHELYLQQLEGLSVTNLGQLVSRCQKK